MEDLTIIAAGGIVKNRNGEILMIYRRGYWDLPKGKQDDGETIEACALREVREETGLQDLQIDRFIATTRHRYYDDKFTQKNVVKITHWYAMSVPGTPELRPQAEEDIEMAEWAGKEKLEAYLHQTYDNIKEVICAYFASAE